MSEKIPFQIRLGNNLFAWVDEEDICLAGMGWSAKKSGSKGLPQYYAVNSTTIAGQRFLISLHTLVWERMMDAQLPPNFLVDHINGDKLDNRRSNLRLATRNDNEANKRKRRSHKKKDGTTDTSSKYKGVTKIKDGRKKFWRAIISTNANNMGKTKQVNLGTYYSERAAAEAYNKAALEMYGEFALINEFEEDK